MTAIFLILFFCGLIFVGMPIAGCILVSAASIPLFMGAASPLMWTQIAGESINGAVANNVGLTIVLFMVAGEFMARGKLTDKIFDTFPISSERKKDLCLSSP